MFTCIERSARRSRLRPARTQLSKVAVPGGSPFYILRANARVPADELFRLSSRCAPVVLTNLPIPAHVPVRAFEPYAFPLRRTAYTLRRLLREAALPAQRVTIGVRDPRGALCGSVCAFLPYAADVRVVTQNAAACDADVLRASREWGAGLTAGEDEALLRGCTFCLEKDGCTAPDGTVMAPQPVELPPAYASRRPPCIEPALFCAALCELCGVVLPQEALPNCVLFGGQTMDYTDAAARIRAQSGL